MLYFFVMQMLKCLKYCDGIIYIIYVIIWCYHFFLSFSYFYFVWKRNTFNQPIYVFFSGQALNYTVQYTCTVSWKKFVSSNGIYLTRIFAFL